MAEFGPYPARVVRVVDGDTVILDLDLGFGLYFQGEDWDGHVRLSCRVLGINAPELGTPEGEASKVFAESLLRPGMIAEVVSTGWDKYGGRFDGLIALPDGRDFGQAMLKAGQAKAYTR